MNARATFDLDSAVAQAEAGEFALWEDIARFLLKQRKPKTKRSKSSEITWAHVTLADGREYLTSCAKRETEAKTQDAHAAYAQFRAKMEDAGSTDRNRVFLDPLDYRLPVAVKSVVMVTDGQAIEAVRDRCYLQRGTRQGWIVGDLMNALASFVGESRYFTERRLKAA